MRIKLMTQIKTIIKTIEIVMTMEIIAVRTKMFLQRIVQVLKISLMKIKHRHIQKIAPEQSDNGEATTETNTDESNNSAN